MKQLKCSDVSGMPCGFVATGQDSDSTKQMLTDHGNEAHPEMMAAATDEQKAMMGAKMDSMMTDDGASMNPEGGSMSPGAPPESPMSSENSTSGGEMHDESSDNTPGMM